MTHNLFCVELEILCFVLLCILLRGSSKHRKPNGFDYVLGIYIMALSASAANVFRLLADGHESLSLVTHLSSIVYLGSFGIIGFLWLLYCDEHFETKIKKSKGVKLVCAVPAIVALLLIATSWRTGMIYFVDSTGGYHRGSFYYLLLIGYIYVVIATVLAVFSFGRYLPGRAKTVRIQLALSAVPTVLIGAISLFLVPEGLQMMTFSVFVSLLILFVNSQYKKMLIDNLTKLPNRYGMDEEIEEQLEQYRKDKNDSFYIIACDMDNFKHINDTWGHAEGDRALRLIADVLIRVAEKNNSMAFRIGGDEFVIITDTSENGLAEEVCNQLKDELDQIDFRDDFDIKMSMGIALYDGTATISELMNNADLSLYEVKRKGKVDF